MQIRSLEGAFFGKSYCAKVFFMSYALQYGQQRDDATGITDA